MSILKKTFKLEIRLENLGVGEKGELELKELMKEYIEELKIDLSNNQGIKNYENKVYVLPKLLDEKVARLHLAKVGAELDELTTEQAAYLGIPQVGPFKSDMYRY